VNGPIEWIAAIGTIIAAALVAADLGRKVTGWGFVLFSVVACLWVYSGLTASDGMPIAIQNGLLLIVNIYGVWQFLISRKKKREIELVEQATVEVKEQIAHEEEAKA
jgi:nicotinamide riboside transporter PnuC